MNKKAIAQGGIELRTFRLGGRRSNHLATTTACVAYYCVGVTIAFERWSNRLLQVILSDKNSIIIPLCVRVVTSCHSLLKL